MCREWLLSWWPESHEPALDGACTTEIIPTGKSSRPDEIIQKTPVKSGKPSSRLWMFWSFLTSYLPPSERTMLSELGCSAVCFQTASAENEGFKLEEEKEKRSLCDLLIRKRHYDRGCSYTGTASPRHGINSALQAICGFTSRQAAGCCPAQGVFLQHSPCLSFSLTTADHVV